MQAINSVLLFVGLGLGLFNLKSPKSLGENVLRRVIFLTVGFLTAILIGRDFLTLTASSLLLAVLIGLLFFAIHLFVSIREKPKPSWLQSTEITPGLIKTSFLLYFLELPGEEFLYRLAILLPAVGLFGPVIAQLISLGMFLFLHLRTWKNKFVWFGSAILGLVCGFLVLHCKSIWPAVIVHNLNDFAFLTIIGKRDLFSDSEKT